MVKPDPKNTLQNVITYLCFKTNTLSQTKLMKLVYLADVYHMQKYGSRLTDVPFRYWHYGPFAEEVNNELERLCGEGIIKQECYQTRAGYIAEIPTPRVENTTVKLSKKALAILDTIIDEWGDSSTEEVVTYAKTTLPFIGTTFGEDIDFKRMDIVEELAKKKNISLREVATSIVENNKDLMKSLDRAKEKVKAQSLP